MQCKLIVGVNNLIIIIVLINYLCFVNPSWLSVTQHALYDTHLALGATQQAPRTIQLALCVRLLAGDVVNCVCVATRT